MAQEKGTHQERGSCSSPCHPPPCTCLVDSRDSLLKFKNDWLALHVFIYLIKISFYFLLHWWICVIKNVLTVFISGEIELSWWEHQRDRAKHVKGKNRCGATSGQGHGIQENCALWVFLFVLLNEPYKRWFTASVIDQRTLKAKASKNMSGLLQLDWETVMFWPKKASLSWTTEDRLFVFFSHAVLEIIYVCVFYGCKKTNPDLHLKSDLPCVNDLEIISDHN